MSKSQRDKGAAAEREASALLRDLLGECVSRRKLDQTREGGFDVAIGDLIGVEVKRQERASLHAWLQQVELATADQALLPAVMWRPSRRGWVVAMGVDDWATLVREALAEADLPRVLRLIEGARE